MTSRGDRFQPGSNLIMHACIYYDIGCCDSSLKSLSSNYSPHFVNLIVVSLDGRIKV